MAHAEVFLSHKKRVQPHGQEWKSAYQKLALPFLNTEGLDPMFVRVFGHYLQNPSASSGANLSLAMVLRSFDQPREVILITDIAENTHFALPNGMVFRKGEQLRKRFRCECINNKRIYLFSPLAEIKPIGNIGIIS